MHLRFDALLQQVALGVGQPGGEVERCLVGEGRRDDGADAQGSDATLTGDVVHVPVPDVADVTGGGRGSGCEGNIGVEGSADDDLGGVRVAGVRATQGVGQRVAGLYRVWPIGNGQGQVRG